MKSQLAKIVWTLVVGITLVDMLLYLKRARLETEVCDCVTSQRRVAGERRGAGERGDACRGTSAAEGHLGNDSASDGHEVDCRPGAPCAYPEEVAFRVIVITYDRAESLRKLLGSLDAVELDGDVGMLEIWIDRGKSGAVSAETVAVARDFRWRCGRTRVHVQREHAGIYGQWIDTWRPLDGTREIAVILEDDLSVSPHVYRWLRAARDRYGARDDIAGYTLQSEGVNRARGRGAVPAPNQDVAYLYQLMGSWGFAPHPEAWSRFQDWYHSARADPDFRPYVDGLIMTAWYKSFEKKHKSDSMWTMWFIYYCDKHALYTVYNNIGKAAGVANAYLAQNRKEPGLHFKGTGVAADKLLMRWAERYAAFPQEPVILDFAGKRKTL